jgi:hypothetical protein
MASNLSAVLFAVKMLLKDLLRGSLFF